MPINQFPPPRHGGREPYRETNSRKRPLTNKHDEGKIKPVANADSMTGKCTEGNRLCRTRRNFRFGKSFFRTIGTNCDTHMRVGVFVVGFE